MVRLWRSYDLRTRRTFHLHDGRHTTYHDGTSTSVSLERRDELRTGGTGRAAVVRRMPSVFPSCQNSRVLRTLTEAEAAVHGMSIYGQQTQTPARRDWLYGDGIATSKSRVNSDQQVLRRQFRQERSFYKCRNLEILGITYKLGQN